MSDIKTLLSKIKTADRGALPPPPSGGAIPGPASTIPGPQKSPGSYTPSSGGYVSPSSVIAKMQRGMQDLAQAVMKDAHSSTIFRKQPDGKPNPTTPEVDASKKSFNDFIAEQYIGGLDPQNKGVEWSVRPNVNTYKEKVKGQTDIYELDSVMDTLRRIGMQNSELNFDGNWEFRTNNALKNIMGFAYAMVQLEGDFGFTNKFFNAGDLAKFQKIMSNITTDDNGNLVYNTTEQQSVPMNVRNEKATQLIPLIDGIKKMYQQFRLHIIGNPEYKLLIESQKPFESYNQQGTSPNSLNKSESQSLNSELKGAIVHGLQYPVREDEKQKTMKNIPLSALKSKADFLAWMKHNELNEAAAIRVFNNFIKPQIEAL